MKKMINSSLKTWFFFRRICSLAVYIYKYFRFLFLFSIGFLFTFIFTFSKVPFSFCLEAAEAADNETLIKKYVKQLPRFVPLEKVTIGPTDNFRSTSSLQHNKIFFAQKLNLATHVFGQELGSDKSFEVIDRTFDSGEPKLSPDESKLVFVYFKNSARGDICYTDVKAIKNLNPNLSLNQNSKNPRSTEVQKNSKDSKEGQGLLNVNCFSNQGYERHSPFWFDNKTIGFIQRTNQNEKGQIIKASLESGKTEVLLEGDYSNPTVFLEPKPILVSSDFDKDLKRKLIIYHLDTKKQQIINIDLPGVSGFPAFSKDGKYLYFSHFLNDSNNDLVIDGNDNSVIFRLPVEKLLSEKPLSLDQVSSFKQEAGVLPEQLTSVTNNCSFPDPQAKELYVTCANSGSLDIYKLPLSGIVPIHWQKEDLTAAVLSSRSYEDRILIHNVLRYRFPEFAQGSFLKKILNNHLLAGEMTSSLYYIDQLSAQAKDKKEKDFYALLKLFVLARQLKLRESKEQNEGEFTDAYISKLKNLEKRALVYSSYPSFQSLLKSLLLSYQKKNQEALKIFKKISLSTEVSSTERYLYNLLLEALLEDTNKEEKWLAYEKLILSCPSSEIESQIYYTMKFLEYTQKQKDLSSQAIDFSQRKLLLEKLKLKVKEPAVLKLLEAEQISLKILEAKDSEKREIYNQLDKLMIEVKNDYFLRKAIYIRSILNLAEQGDYQYLNYVAGNWLKYTQKNQMEFIYAREQFVFSVLSRAYDNYSDKQYKFAANNFYSVLSMTDDLESHYGYVSTKILLGEQESLRKNYENLSEAKVVDENQKYVKALLLLIFENKKTEEDTKTLEKAISILESMSFDSFNPDLKYLLLGYSYFEKVQRQAKAYDFDQSDYDKANRNFMLAKDANRENFRIKASALMNLGHLHLFGGNYSLAARYFSERKKYGFVDFEEQVAFTWLYAQTLFYSEEAKQASLEMKEIYLDKRLNQQLKAPFLERLAFYYQNSENFLESKKAYESLIVANDELKNLDKKSEQERINLLKIYLSYGYTLYKLKDPFAKVILEKALMISYSLSSPVKGKHRRLPFYSLRNRIIALGLLAQVSSVDEVAYNYLKQREKLLLESRKQWSDLSINEEDGLIWTIKAKNQKLSYYVRVLGPSSSKAEETSLSFLNKGSQEERSLAAAQEAQEILDLCSDFAKLTNNYISQTLFISLSNIYVLNQTMVNKKLLNNQGLNELTDKVIQSLEKAEKGQVFLTYQKLQLSILRMTAHELNKDVLMKKKSEIRESKDMELIRKELPQKYEQLNHLISQ